MQKIFGLSAVFCGILVLCGCTCTVSSDGASSIPQIDTCHPGFHAKFDIKEKRLSGQSDIHVLLGIFAWGSDGFAENTDLSCWNFMPSAENFAKQAAVFDACRKYQIDTLLGTRYQVTTTNYLIYKKIECTVSGFPAIMTGLMPKKPYAIGKKLVWCAEKPQLVN